MKIGDKLICIKTLNSLHVDNMYYKDKIYSLTDISFNDFLYENSYEINNALWFNYNKNGAYYIEEYFISLTKIRKEKLLKIQHDSI